MQKLLTLPVFLFLAQLSIAQTASRNWDKPMELQKCSVAIKADLFTATTFIEMEFFNPNNQEIEGLYRFQLLPGQAVTALQLDLFGKLRDGTIEEKWKAANAYNTIVGKRVDPALLQMDGYNHYSLRIYPVPARSTRRITITVQQVLRPEKDTIHYYLPLTSKNQIKAFDVDINVSHLSTNALVKEGLLKEQVFQYNSAGQRIRWTANERLWDRPITFSIPLPKKDIVCVKRENEKHFFAARHFSAVEKTAALRPKTAAVYWDVSYSGKQRDTEKEISFLKQYAAYYGLTDVYIVPFNFKAAAPVHFQLGEGAGWLRYLRSLTYTGATRLGVLKNAMISADVSVLVTDGQNSLGTTLPQFSNQPVFCVHAGKMPDNQSLHAIVGKGGGRVIDLHRQNMSTAVALAGKVENVLLEVSSASGQTLIDLQEQKDGDGSWLLAGTTAGNTDTLIFNYGHNGRSVLTEKVVLSSDNHCVHTSISMLPVLARFDDLLKKGDWQQQLYFGKDEKIVTYRTSFIVLEKVEDYVKYNIEPPKELEEACENMQPGFLVQNRKQRRDERLRYETRRSQYEILNTVASQYVHRMKKWGSNETMSLSLPDVINANNVTASAGAATGNPSASPQVTQLPAGFGDANLDEVVVTAYASQKKRDMTVSTTIVRSKDLLSGATSVEQALSGRVAGLVVTPNNGYSAPGSTSLIQLRGAASLSQSSPLYVLDGVPLGGDVKGDININHYVNVADIDNIEVMRDINGAAIYGSRGANGVVLIKTKRGRAYYNYSYNKPYRLKDMDDVDYLAQIKLVRNDEKLATYNTLQPGYATVAAFYLDMGQHLYESGFRADAVNILGMAAEVLPNNRAIQRTVAAYLEQWGEWQEAIAVYEELLKAAPNDVMSHRDLALAYSRIGNYQQAVDLLYQGIITGEKEQFWLGNGRELLLNELNAIAAAHGNELKLAHIPAALLKPLPVDLRIVMEGAGYGFYGVTVVEPGGKECTEWQEVKCNGYFMQTYTSGSHVREYQVKQAPAGHYKLRVRYHDYYNGSNPLPAIIKLTIYKNFGKPYQTVEVENIVMDNQQGTVEIADINF
jgi:TonB-dependent SusC/RagA subfamily outer membrane receptor